jgi:hypothetical protein
MDSVRTRLKEAAISQPMTAPSKILSSVRQEFSDNVDVLQALPTDSNSKSEYHL